MSNRLIVSSLEEINDSQVSHTEKSNSASQVVLHPNQGDAGKFIATELSSLSDADFHKVLHILLKFEPVVLSLCRSENITSVVELVRARHNASLSLMLLEYFEIGALHFKLIPAHNFDRMTEFSISCISASDLSLAEKSCVFLDNCVRTLHQLALVAQIQHAGQVFTKDSVVYMRFMHLLSQVSTYGDEQFRAVEACGAVESIVGLCKTNDILVQINVIELLTGLASTHAGLDCLCERGILQWVITTACGESGASDSSSSNNGACNGNVNGNSPASSRPDPLIATLALRVLGSIFVKAAHAKYHLAKHMDEGCFAHFLRQIHSYFEDGGEEEKLAGRFRYRNRTIQCVSCVAAAYIGICSVAIMLLF
jgi:hypothetical protein